MKLKCFPLGHFPVEVRPAPATRTWQDETPKKFAYRCLPLNIGNGYGWELTCAHSFSAQWTGGPEAGSLVLEDIPQPSQAESHFGSGILSIHTDMIFRLEPGWDLMVTGPSNYGKDGITPLTAVVESDWLPFPFTMNWRFTRVNTWVHFEKGEPFCRIFPIRRRDISQVEVEIHDLEADPQTRDYYQAWCDDRDRVLALGGDTRWHRWYMKGCNPDGTPGTTNHVSKLHLPWPLDKRRED